MQGLLDLLSGGGAKIGVDATLGSLFSADLMKEIGISAVLGFAVGYASKQFGKIAMLTVGASFILLQVAMYCGWITAVNWETMNTQFVARFDMDGDGIFSFMDVKLLVNALAEKLGCGAPSMTTFTAMFMTALYFG